MQITPCKCGATPEVVKLWESKRYDCFLRCPKCGRETRCYSSKQNAVKRWNRMVGEDGRISHTDREDRSEKE